LEQTNLTQNWDETDPITNTAGGAAARTAQKIKVFLCSSDVIPQNPVTSGGLWYGLTSYGGNGGTRTYDPQLATNDGVFFVIGSGSQTAPNGQAVRGAEITDGLSNTILFGERSHSDANHDSFVAGFGSGGGGGGGGAAFSTMGAVGWWAPSGGRLAGGDVLLSAFAPINFRIAQSYANRSLLSPPANSATAFQSYYDQRLNAFGSSHPGGANFAFADGSTRLLRQTLPQADLVRLCVRDDGQAVNAD
jgi:prepilin-type processing-associated H-X9-DG protein